MSKFKKLYYIAKCKAGIWVCR